MDKPTTVPPLRGTEPAVPVPVPIESLRMMTVRDVADLAGICEESILRRIRRGDLKAKRLGKGWRIPHEEVVRLLTP